MLRFIFRKRVGVLLLFFIVCVGGFYSVTQLPVQLYPRTMRPRMYTSISHDGYSAIAFSEEFADTIESQMLTVEGVDLLEVRYGSNRSSFTFTFDWQTDAERAKVDVEAALSSVMSRLPISLQSTPRVRFSTGENAGYLMLGVSSRTVSPEILYELLMTDLEPSLSQVKDVEVIEIFNVEDLDVTITLRQLKMLSYGLTISDVNSSMRTNGSSQSVGPLREGRSSVSVRYSRGALGLLDLPKLPIADIDDVTVRLEDIADVEIEYTVPRSTFVMDGTRGIQVIATPIDGGNIRTMSDRVTDILQEARQTGILPEDTEITLFLDPSDYINRSIASVLQAAIIGAVLAMLVVLLALGEVRNTLLIGVSLPVSLVISFVLMYAFDVSLNLISLGGMALAVGMIVDSSIVVMENIHRFRADEDHSGDNQRLKELINRAVTQVRIPVVASILTSILVFLPISFTAPLTNAILGDQAKVVVFALSFSLVVALTLIPLLAFLVYKGRSGSTPSNKRHVRPRFRIPTVAGLRFLERMYTKILRPVVSHKSIAVGLLVACVALLAVSVLVVLPKIPKEIISPPSSDRLVIFMRTNSDITSQEIVEETFPSMNKLIYETLGEYIENTYAEVRGGFNRLFVVLRDTRDVDFVTGELQRLFESDNQWYYNIMNWDPAQLPLPRTSDLQISVEGDDRTAVAALLEQVRDVVSELSLYAWVYTTPTTSYTDELILSPRIETLGRLPGYSEGTLLGLMQRALIGTQSMEFVYEGLSVSANARYPADVIQGRHNLENFLIPFQGTAVPFKHFFEISESTSVSQIASENGELIFRAYGIMNRGESASNRQIYEDKVREALADTLDVPEGYSVTFDNPQIELDSAVRSLFISLAVSVVLIYLLLAFQFNSLGIPLVILVSIPLGFVGLVLSLYFFQSTLSLNSLLGAILLSGIVVNNAIILIDFYRTSIGEYANRMDALIETARIRFRPIVITTLTTIVGMLPIAIGFGEGSNVIQPLGIAVSGGLLVSTTLTLFVVPAILSLVRLRTEN
jgi:hydrophobic/amphiphilic exporter-1 (mainly G- bacteria), HAE1 family